MSRTNDLLKSLDSNDFVEVDEDDGITTLIDLDDIFNGMETSAALSNRPVVYPIDEMRDRVEESLEKFENTTFDNEGKWVHAQPNPAASPWPTAFMVDLALDIFDLDHILNKHSVDVEYYTALLTHLPFNANWPRPAPSYIKMARCIKHVYVHKLWNR